ncbi:MAG: nuclear transport factor 2 family protein [Pseudomonadota bacterium]
MMYFGNALKGLVAAMAIAGPILTATGVRADPVTELERLNDRFNEAVANHDPDAVLSLYADDTIWIEQGKPASQGLDGPRKLFEFVTANKGEVTHSIDTLFVSDDGTLAVMIGSVVARMESVGMDATGTYLYVLKPSEDGWKVVTDMWHQHAE